MAERWLLLAVPLLLAGCFGKDGGDEDDDDDGGGGGGWDSGWTDGGGSDGGGSDGGGSDGGGSDGGGGGDACPDLFPLHRTGQVATYEYRDGSGIVGGFTMEFQGESSFEGGTGWQVRTDAAYSGEGYEAVYTLDTWYRCDSDGAWLLYQEQDSTTWTSAGETAYQSWSTAVEPGLVMPKSVDVGDTWTQSYVLRTVDSYGNDTEYAYSIDYQVEAGETIEVPAGAFDTLYIEQTFDDSVTGWYAAEGVGMVQNGTTWLVGLD